MIFQKTRKDIELEEMNSSEEKIPARCPVYGPLSISKGRCAEDNQIRDISGCNNYENCEIYRRSNGGKK